MSQGGYVQLKAVGGLTWRSVSAARTGIGNGKALTWPSLFVGMSQGGYVRLKAVAGRMKPEAIVRLTICAGNGSRGHTDEPIPKRLP